MVLFLACDIYGVLSLLDTVVIYGVYVVTFVIVIFVEHLCQLWFLLFIYDGYGVCSLCKP